MASSYFVRRLLFALVVIWGAGTFVFILAQLIPSDPVRFALGDNATKEMIDNYRQVVGLDQPIVVQYLRYFGRLVQGDFGKSILSRRPVIQELGNYLPATIELILFSLAISIPVGLGLGVVAGTSRGSSIDTLSRLLAMAGMSLPVFWYGLVLQLIFYKYLDLLPAGGRLDTGLVPPPETTGLYLVDSLTAGNIPVFLSALRHLVLPGVALSTVTIAAISRMTRSCILNEMREDYVRTAYGKGLPARTVYLRHALRNAVAPVVTEIGLRIGHLMGGAVLTETIFAWPGLGRFAVFSVIQVDLPVVMAFTLWMSLAYCAINLLVDLSYGYFDPRTRLA